MSSSRSEKGSKSTESRSAGESSRLGSSSRSGEASFTVFVTPELPDHDMLPNFTVYDVYPSDLLSTVVEKWENAEGVSDMLEEGEIWKYFRGLDEKAVKTRYSMKRNGLDPATLGSQYIDLIARPGFLRGEEGEEA
ncbi:hypothetical protein TWF281_004744 [Arthrobotrys megalospora]